MVIHKDMGADNTFGETNFNPDKPAKKVQWSGYGPLGNISQKPKEMTREELVAKYKAKITELQKRRDTFDGTGRGGACISVTGEIQAYNAIIADLQNSLSPPPAEGAEEKPTIAETLRGAADHRERLAVLEKHMGGDFYETGQYHVAISEAMKEYAAQQQPKLDPKKVQWSGYGELGNISQKPLQPTAEGAEEYFNNSDWGKTLKIQRSRHIEVSYKAKDMVEFAQEFATLHAHKIADKMASERQREMWLNMQYYMEYCQYKGYVTPQEWIEKHKHF
jgi:hypothetical protein